MRAKFLAAAATVSAAVVGMMGVAKASALFEIPTSTVDSFTASVSDTLADPGLLLIIGVIIALPVVFWLIHRVKALFPKTSSR